MGSFEKSSPILGGNSFLNGLLNRGNKNVSGNTGANILNGQKEVIESIKQMDQLIFSLMSEVEKNSIEYHEKMTNFFQQGEEDSFREVLLKYIQSEYRFQDLSILDQQKMDFIESIRMCYRNMQEKIKKGLKASQQEIDYLNLFSKLLQIKENLIKIYQDLGNYQFPLTYADSIKLLQKFIRYLNEERFAYSKESQRGLGFYASFLKQELQVLLNLTQTLHEQEEFYEIYQKERMICSLLRLKDSIVKWIDIIRVYENDDYSRFKQIIFAQNFHLLLKAKLDFYSECRSQSLYGSQLFFKRPFSKLIQSSSLNNISYIDNINSKTSEKLTNAALKAKVPSNTQFPHQNIQNYVYCHKIDQQLKEDNIFSKLFDKLHEQYPKTIIIIFSNISTDLNKKKLVNKELEDLSLLRKQTPISSVTLNKQQQSSSLIREKYKIVYKINDLPEKEFQEHLKSMMESFDLQISMIDGYIECSNFLMLNFTQQQQLLYKLDEEFYLFFKVYDAKDKKQINSIIEFITQICEYLRSRFPITVSKEGSKPTRTFSDFVREKIEFNSKAKSSSPDQFNSKNIIDIRSSPLIIDSTKKIFYK